MPDLYEEMLYELKLVWAEKAKEEEADLAADLAVAKKLLSNIFGPEPMKRIVVDSYIGEATELYYIGTVERTLLKKLADEGLSCDVKWVADGGTVNNLFDGKVHSLERVLTINW